MKRITALLAALFLVITAGGCGAPAQEQKNSLLIGLLVYNQDDAFISAITSRLRSDAAKVNREGTRVSIVMKDAAGDQRTQNAQAADLIEEGADVLAVNLADRTDPSEIINAAENADVPVIFFNREPVAADLARWDSLYYVGAKTEQAGKLQGEEAAEYIQEHPEIDRNHDGMIQYVVLKGEPGHQDAIIRTETAVNTIVSEGITLDKLGYENADWNRAQAQNRMSQLITEHMTDIELVLANNDEMALGAADAYDASNITTSSRPAIFGVDGTDAGLKAMASGKIQGTVYNDANKQADYIYKIALRLYQRESLESLDLVNGKCIYTSYGKVTAENLDDYRGRK